MKYFIDGVIVVEGTNDESYLSSFIDAHYVVLNGYEIPNSEIEFLNKASETKNIIVLTDSDEAGDQIRTKINKLVPECINVKVDINKCDKKGKHGIKECEKDEIIRVLQGFFTINNVKNNKNFIFLNLIEDCKKIRDQVCKIFKLGKCNNKKMIKRLNFLNISEMEVKEAIGYGD